MASSEELRLAQAEHLVNDIKPLFAGKPPAVQGRALAELAATMNTKENGFEGPLPSSVKPDGFYCRRRGGCDQDALCVNKGECLGAAPSLAITSKRNRFDEFAELVLALTYSEMVEFAGGLWKLRGGRKMNNQTLPQILHAWSTASNRSIYKEPAPDLGKELQPIETAPKDRPILAFMLGQWRIAKWKANHRKRLAPFWTADDLRVTVSRAHQPKWWAELPPLPPETAD